MTDPRPLREADVLPDPLAQVRRWVDEARAAEVRDWDAMVVATADGSGAPSARVVLLRGIDEQGLCFYTNFESRKGHELAANSRMALVLHWREQNRQVRVTGTATRLSAAESVDYWNRRPRASRLSAWASHQSELVADRETLESAVDAVQARFGDDGEVPLPPFWGGYRVVPNEVELWQHREDRLHDRLVYRRAADDSWALIRLQP